MVHNDTLKKIDHDLESGNFDYTDYQPSTHTTIQPLDDYPFFRMIVCKRDMFTYADE